MGKHNGQLLQPLTSQSPDLTIPRHDGYTLGVIFFVFDSRICYSHAVWHGFVAAGTACHFVAVQNYAA